MKKFRFIALCIILVLTVSVCLVSCAKSSNNAERFDGAYSGGAEIPPEAGTEAGSLGTNLGSGAESSEEYERKIIKTANISAQTLSFDKSKDFVEKLCEDLDGYIESSSVSGNGINSKGGSRYADYTMRIPAEKLDSFGGSLEESLKITSYSSSSDEVTTAYYDIKSRIEVLQMQKEALTELYEQYTDYANIDYLIELQDKLYDVIAEIEAYETQIRLYDSKVAYSTVHLHIYEVEEYVEENQSFGNKIVGALSGGWETFVDVCSSITIAFVACLPFIITLGAVAAGIILTVRARKKSRRVSKQENSEQ